MAKIQINSETILFLKIFLFGKRFPFFFIFFKCHFPE